MNKTMIALGLILTMTASVYGQSVKSNSATLSFKIPKKQEQWPFKKYLSKLTTSVYLLTPSDESEIVPASYGIVNDKKKAELATQYLTFFSKTMGQTKTDADLGIELVTTDFVFKDLRNDMASANPEDVITTIEGSAQLKITDVKNGTEVMVKDFAIPADIAVITKEKILTLNPGLSIQLKFVKKTDTQTIEKMLKRGLEATKVHYMHYLLGRAGYVVKGLFEDQKGDFNMPVYLAKGKADYAELEQTSEAFKNMLKGLGKEQTIGAIKSSAANEVIAKSIAVWEKEIAQQSPEKDARINDEIARGLNLNLASAYILTGEWEKASQALGRTGFVIPEGTQLGGTGSAKEYFIDIRKTFFMASGAPDQIVFSN